jgi:hypothetical protein
MKARATSTQPRSNQAGPAADFIDSIGQKLDIAEFICEVGLVPDFVDLVGYAPPGGVCFW